MRKFLTLLAALLIALPLSLPASAEQNPGQPPTLYAEAAILVDADTGQVLYQKNPDKKMYPASITKLMTCLIAMEEAQPDDVVTMTDEAVFAVPRDTTHIALTGGEQLTVEQLEYAMMVESANDAANGLCRPSGRLARGVRAADEQPRRRARPSEHELCKRQRPAEHGALHLGAGHGGHHAGGLWPSGVPHAGGHHPL